MKLPLKNNSTDNYQTPPEALIPLLPYLKKRWVIWECACGKENLVREIKENGYVIYGTDITEGCDFLNDTPPFKYDCITTNPPYSLKTEFLARCYELGKPFALLMPMAALGSFKRCALYKKYGIEIMIFNKRINYERPDGKKSACNFDSVWFAWGLNLPEQMNFVEYVSEPKLF